jgi:hypothetical protein
MFVGAFFQGDECSFLPVYGVMTGIAGVTGMIGQSPSPLISLT